METVAAASVAQVHRAVLRSNGETVPVKVRRPDILEKVQFDRSMVNLALMTAEGLGKRLAPELSLTDEAIPYPAEALQNGGWGSGIGDRVGLSQESMVSKPAPDA